MIYKVLERDGSARMGNGWWHLPKGKRKGKWMPPIKGKLIPCQNGYHLCRETDLLDWLGPAIFEVEYKGEMIATDNKIVVREARLIRECGGWNESTARLFAADCAEHVLHIFEKEHPEDDRPRKAIEAARRFARGEIDAAAKDAAKDAARAAAKDAAGAAARAAAGAAARAAARAAAKDAARVAAKDAAWAAARAAEQKWQRKRLLDYLTSCISETKRAA